MTQDFLNRNPALYGAEWPWHSGVDYAIAPGNDILSAGDGEIFVVESDGVRGYGLHVRVIHPDQSVSIYAHLTSASVRVGEKVRAGQVLGKSGGARDDPNRGLSTGAHLHFEVRPNRGSTLRDAVHPIAHFVNWNSHEYRPAKCVASVGLNVRGGAGVSFARLYALKFGDNVEIVESQSGWLRINHLRAEWIRENHMQIEEKPLFRAGTMAFRGESVADWSEHNRKIDEIIAMLLTLKQ